MTMTIKLEVINKHMPYTYHLYHILTERHYYGSRLVNGRRKWFDKGDA